jgi:stress response protein YsnF
MPRNIAALYDSRAEAELARSRLIAEANATSARIISKDTAGAIEGLGFSASDAEAYREGLRKGAHLLVAEAPPSASPKRIIAVLEQSIGQIANDRDERVWGEPEQGVQVKLPDEAPNEAVPPATPTEPDRKRPGAEWPPRSAAEPVRAAVPAPETSAEVVEEARVPVVDEELRIGKRQVAGGGARVHSFTREEPVEEQVSLREEIVDVEHRPSERRLSEEEVEQAGLFRERVFEITEMREEPVISKVAVIREEIIVRKTVKQRQETVRDTVRHTEVEIDDLADTDRPSPAPTRRGR